MAKPKFHSRNRMTAPMPAQIASELRIAQSHIRGKNWDEAYRVLDSLQRRYPGRKEILGEQLDLAVDMQDMYLYQDAAERLLKLTPNDADLSIGLAAAYLKNAFLASAITAFRRFLERWPEHSRSEQVRKSLASLEEAFEEEEKRLGLPKPDGFEIGLLHERMQFLLQRGRYAEMPEIAERALEKLPGFAPVLNNLSLGYFAEGRLEEAVATAHRALESNPGNIHALSNLVRFYVLSDKTDEAWESAELLKNSPASGFEKYVKIAEALSFMGNDAEVLETFRRAEAEGEDNLSLQSPMLHHLAGVAALRLGDEKQARLRWKEALKLNPAYGLARDNLADLNRRAGERNGPGRFR